MDKNVCVAQVIDEGRKLVLNIGENDGVKIGDTFLIYSESKEEILDPITKKSLGKLEIVKGKGRVTHVQPKICTIESINKKEKTKTTEHTIPRTIFFGENQRTEKETIEVILPFENPQIGDLAKEI